METRPKRDPEAPDRDVAAGDPETPDERRAAARREEDVDFPEPSLPHAADDPSERWTESALEESSTEPPPPPAERGASGAEPEEGAGAGRRRRKLTAWVGEGAKKVASKLYAQNADDLEERARRIVVSAYRDQADDLEERAVRAMRQAILAEADKIKEAVEHGIEVKRREVRLSLVVLVVASLVYLVLYLVTHGGGAG